MMMMTMNNPYGGKPDSISEPSEWHELSFQLSIDKSVDWDNVDLRKWSHTVARFTALMMSKSIEENEDEDSDLIKTLIMGVKVKRISFVTDDELHNMIDDFEE